LLANLLVTFAAGSVIQNECSGREEEWAHCDALPDCAACTPTDCVWHTWGDWQPQSPNNCIGLEFRNRSIQVLANQCGTPCHGSKVESRPKVLDECKPKGSDCVLSQWTQWSHCGSEQEQSIRAREITQQPGVGGHPCLSSLKETKPCGGPPTEDCVFADWQEWTSCSTTCGEGRYTRMRRIKVPARNEGQPCKGMTLETASCEVEECPGQDCTLSAWGEWTACDEAHAQSERTRQVQQAPEGSGKRCTENLAETRGCPHPGPSNCSLTEWVTWSECDKSCGGGQHYRMRKMQSLASNGGHCPLAVLKSIGPCNTQPCLGAQTQDCGFEQWSAWSQCSATCDEGSKTRTRKIAQAATFGGAGCNGSLAELSTCNTVECNAADCAWSDWEEWSECPKSCGGGITHRARRVLVTPTNGGRACPPETKGEVAPCNEQPCGEGCRDGQWGQWREWTECSATCHTSYKSRRRNVEVHPNNCGKAPVGLSEEFVQCTELPPCLKDTDCQVSEWGEWAECSNDCFGIRERNRYIAEYASGNGAACDHGLKQIEPCNPGLHEQAPASCGDAPQQDCQMDEWGAWSPCSVTCGGGQKTRRRSILTPAQNNGRPCQADEMITAPCGTQKCESNGCQDCTWGDWSEWSECDKCGGQTYRHRAIMTMPNHCGARCDLHSAKEVSECPNQCDNVVYCSWSEWSPGQCGQRCGNTTTARNRALSPKSTSASDYLFIGLGEVKCAGSQVNQSLCPFTSPCSTCTPIDCKFGEWSEWNAPSCQGLCERSREIESMNNECGEPCTGPLVSTKECLSTPCDVKKDCVLSDWSAWTECTQGSNDGQKYRARQITQKPEHGGKDCQELVLSETVGCDVHGPQICELGDWKEWSSCSVSCGMGWHVRVRDIAQPSRRGGLPCAGDLKELDHCEDVSCHGGGTIDCKLSPWGQWSMCGVDGQRYRDRKIEQPAANEGEACEGGMHETETCALDRVDCACSDWTAWDQCDVQCGRGQQHRQRQISQFPQNGGKTCPHDLMQTKGCDGPQGPCEVEDCKMSDWEDWTSCSVTCGPGTKNRNRRILSLRDFSGKGCAGALGQTEQCGDNAICESTECTWSTWSPWSACDKSCEGGQKRRHRQIATQPSTGNSCEAKSLAEIDSCNDHACGGDTECQDAEWGSWTEWTSCSATCDGGTTSRHRKIVKSANACGCLPDGKDREMAFCNVEVHCGESVDCELSSWTPWTPCSATCNGVTERKRNVKQYGSGNGKFCEGSLHETNPCNPGVGEKTLPPDCLSGPRVDCELSPWAPWSICGKTCGGDQQLRTRRINRHPSNGGKPCSDALTEIKECARNPCNEQTPIDCKVGDWEDWAECDRCSGEKKRLRELITEPQHGGVECDPTAMEEIGKCDRTCHEETVCEWNGWEPWTKCSMTCGKGGKKVRQRQLHRPRTPEPGTMTSYETLSDKVTTLDSRFMPEMLLAFAAGCVAVLAAVGGFRVLSRVTNIRRWQERRLRPDPESGTYHHLDENDSEIRLVAETSELE